MFCTKCGKRLYDGDAFCAHCGTKVREELLFKSESKTSPRLIKFDEVVFNPPFKAEAEKRTQHIEEEVNLYSSEPKKEKLVFDWNLEGFPTSERKKDENFEINWDAVVEKNREARAINVEKILPETGFKTETVEEPQAEVESELDKPLEVEPVKKQEESEDEPLSIEALELALFGTEDFEAVDTNMPGVTIEYKTAKSSKKREADFYTYNSKRDAFQELLDKERARLKALENERNSQWEEIAPIKASADYVPKKALEFDEVFKEPKLPLTPPLREVAVVLPPLTAMVMADEEEPEYEVALPPLTAKIVAEVKEEVDARHPFLEEKPSEQPQSEPAGTVEPAEEPSTEATEPAAEEPKEKPKLKYSDIFPMDSPDSDGNNKSNKFFEEEVDDDEEEGSNIVVKLLIVILAIIVLFEIVVIGVKFVAPESNLAVIVDNVMDKITGGEQTEEDGSSDIVIDENRIESYITTLGGSSQNVGIINHDANLKYQLTKTYAFQDINQTNDFQDVVWEGATNKTNGYLIIEAIISYYDTWKYNNPQSEIVGVNQVTIGEIRTGSSGYYVLNKVIYAGEGAVLEKYETVYLEASQEKITVKEVKEETI